MTESEMIRSRRRALAAILLLGLLGAVALVLVIAMPDEDEPQASGAPTPTSNQVGSIFATATVLAATQASTQLAFAATPAPLPATGGGGGDFASTGGGGGQNVNTTFSSQSNQALQDRIILKDAYMSIVVKDAESVITQITHMVEGMGGWIVQSDLYVISKTNNSAQSSGTLRVRVPAQNLDEALTSIRALALEVRSANITGTDVTDAYADAQSQLRNLKAAEEQLLAIMQDANTTEDVLSVFNQLTSTRGEIERLQGQLQFYDQASAYSSISIDISPDIPTPTPSATFTPTPTYTPTPEVKWNAGDTFADAKDSAEATVQDGVDVAIYVVVYGLLVLVIFGLPALGFYGWWRRQK